MTLYTWSQTAATNATADATINWAEGMAGAAVNNSARAEMAAVAKYRDDHAGTLTTGGSSTAYTVTSNQVFASLAAMNGMSLRVKFNVANGAAPTLSVDGLGAKAIQTIAGSAIGTGVIPAGTVHDLVYDNSNSAWVLVGHVGASAKCWAYVTVSGGTPTLQASENITSITDTDVGQLTITIATDFSSVNWVSVVTCSATDMIGTASFASKATGSQLLAARDIDTSALADPSSYNFVGFGAQ